MASNPLRRNPKWTKLLSTERLRTSNVGVGDRSKYDARTPFENDYDRVIFSSSFRRLKNKAQVFSLEGHDFVRTRLTHSIEVSTIGRALGEGVAKHLGLNGRDIGSLVATACLLHDIGNPPFGHSGERAIGSWFSDQRRAQHKLLIDDPQEIHDLSAFEGNSQALRIATRTQWSGYDYGMNLTAATLSTLIKYPCSSIQSRENGPKALSKFGYFKDDHATFEEIRTKTGLSEFARHPLTFLVEAADDIAYATGDIEDVLKKGIVDYESIRSILKKGADDQSLDIIKRYLDKAFKDLASVKNKRERQQLSVQRFSQAAVRMMTKSAIECFVNNSDSIVNGIFDDELVERMSIAHLCRSLKAVMKSGVYSHVEIAHREQASQRVIHGILDVIVSELKTNPNGALAQSVYTKAPKNPRDHNRSSKDYKIALRMTDYVSGMTDGFALAQYQRMNAMGAQL